MGFAWRMVPAIGLVWAVGNPAPLWAAAPTPPKGFVLAAGGGKETARTTTRTSIYAAAWRKLHENLARGATVGRRYCVVETSEDSPSDDAANEYFASFKAMWEHMGQNLADLGFHNFSTRTRANQTALVTAFANECGVVHLPGGDQTAVRAMWEGTRFHSALKTLLARGGGISGNSAGAALLGSVQYLPSSAATSEETEGGLLSDPDVASNELQSGFVTAAIKDMPRFYAETHTEQRERVGRALALLAQESRRSGKRDALALAIDIDTGVLVSWNESIQAWTGTVVGGRSVEFLIPTRGSRMGISSRNYPYATHFRSHLLLRGGSVVLSGSLVGSIVATSASDSFVASAPVARCSQRLADDVRGDADGDMERASQVSFDVRVRDVEGRPTTVSGRERISLSEHVASGSVDSMLLDSYVTGDLFARKLKTGCGFWVPSSFDLEHGQRRNRLPAQRFALGKGLAAFAVALPTGMDAVLTEATKGVYRFERGAGPSSSFTIYDVRNAKMLATPTYVYSEYGATAPLATGVWHDGLVHLLPPESTYGTLDGAVALPPL